MPPVTEWRGSKKGRGCMVFRAVVGGVLSMLSAGCWGLSLGQFAGQAIMGQPLSVQIPLGLVAGEVAADLCPVVKVYFAEDALPSNQVKLSVRTDSVAGSAALHVSTSNALTEPYVRIDVRAGCTNQFSRQYTLLADMPNLEEAPSSKKMPTASLVAAARQTYLARPLPAESNERTQPNEGSELGAAQGSMGTPARVVKTALKPVAPTLAKTVRVSEKAFEPQGARLQLDPLELIASMAQLAPALKLASGNLSIPESDADAELAERRNAARALWRVMNEAPEQVVTAAVKSDAVVAEGVSLKSQLATAVQAQAQLQQALEAEREGVYSHPLVVALGGGLLMALGGMAMLWRRQSSSSKDSLPWWTRPVSKAAVTEQSGSNKKKPFALKAVLQKWLPVGKKSASTNIDTTFPFDSQLEERPIRRSVTQKKTSDGTTTIGGQDFLPSILMDGARSVATEELFDLQQQVEFFISLGQAEQAVDVLVSHLSDSHEPSPLAYLDLLRLYHDLDRRSDYEALRKDFNRLFSGAAPTFEDYSYSRRGLERYEAALSRIQSLWPTPAVLDVIECSIFRQPSSQNQDVFDLEAYRELLLLYGIAREIIAPDSMMGSMGVPSSFGFLGDEAPTTSTIPTVMQPLTAQTLESRAKEDAAFSQPSLDLELDDAEPSQIPVLGSGIPLDIDLSLDITSISEQSIQPSEVTAVQSRGDEDPMSFDLSDSLFDSLPEPGESKRPNSEKSAKIGVASEMDEGTSLDFSDLGDLEAFTIKKSGIKS